MCRSLGTWFHTEEEEGSWHLQSKKPGEALCPGPLFTLGWSLEVLESWKYWTCDIFLGCSPFVAYSGGRTERSAWLRAVHLARISQDKALGEAQLSHPSRVPSSELPSTKKCPPRRFWPGTLNMTMSHVKNSKAQCHFQENLF